jgi:hypothetical protein
MVALVFMALTDQKWRDAGGLVRWPALARREDVRGCCA